MNITKLSSDNIFAYCEQLKSLGEKGLNSSR